MSQYGNDNNSKYDPAYCKQLIEHMASGCSFATFGARVGVGFRTLKTWQKTHEDFAEAVDLGELVLMYTWEKIIIGQAQGIIKGLPATTIFALKNYFPEKFKENTALQGNGNTIVIFDSGVPSKQDQIEDTPFIEVESRVGSSTNQKRLQNAVSDQVRVKQDLPSYITDGSYIPIKEGAYIQDSDILSEDDI